MIETLEEHIEEMKDREEKCNKKCAIVLNQDKMIDKSREKLKKSEMDAKEDQLIREH